MILHSLALPLQSKTFHYYTKKLVIIFGSISNMQRGGYVCLNIEDWNED